MRKPVPSKRAAWIRGAAVVLTLLALTGCDLLTVSQTGRNIREGNEALVRGEVQRALQHFEAALDGTMLSAEAHYRLGLLYEDQLKNEVGALHHFERYLELAPQGQFATDVKGYVDRLRLLIVSRFSDGPVMPAREATRLKNENLELKQQLADLRESASVARPTAPAVKTPPSAVKPANPAPAVAAPTPEMVVAATPPPAPAAPVAPAEPEVRRAVPVGEATTSSAAGTDVAPRVQPIASAGSATVAPAVPAATAGGAPVRTHKVQSGDTLAGIARKFYQNSGQWQKILEANKATLTDPTKLKPGMVLVIP